MEEEDTYGEIGIDIEIESLGSGDDLNLPGVESCLKPESKEKEFDLELEQKGANVVRMDSIVEEEAGNGVMSRVWSEKAGVESESEEERDSVESDWEPESDEYEDNFKTD